MLTSVENGNISENTKFDENTNSNASSTSPTQTIRLNLNLEEPDEEKCSVFDYRLLIANEKKKRRREKSETLQAVPLEEENDDDDVKRLAQHFENKYSNNSIRPKKNKKRKLPSYFNYSKLGSGYDTCDSFIDDSELDDGLPDNKDTKHGGYYVNVGELEFREIYIGDENSGDEEMKWTKRKGKILSSDDDETGKIRTETKNKENTSDQKTDNSAQKVTTIEHKPSEDVVMKEPTMNGIGIKIECVSHKPREKPISIIDNSDAADVKNSNINGLPTVIPKKENQKKRNRSDEEDAPKPKKKLTVRTSLDEKQAVENGGGDNNDIIKCNEHFSNTINDVIEAVVNMARNSCSESSSDSIFSSDEDYDDTDTISIESKNSADEGVTHEKVINSQTQADVFTKPRKEDFTASTCLETNDQSIIIKGKKLPESVAALIRELSSEVKRLEMKPENGKRSFKTESINKILYSLEVQSRILKPDLRHGLYEYMTRFFPLSKDTLMKRAKTLLREEEEKYVSKPFNKLKECVQKMMPSSKDKHYNPCMEVIEKQNKEEIKKNDGEMISNPMVSATATVFIWTDECRNLLKNLISCREKAYRVLNMVKITEFEYVRKYLESKVKPLWPDGCMELSIILKEAEFSNNSSLKNKTMYTHVNTSTLLPGKISSPSFVSSSSSGTVNISPVLAKNVVPQMVPSISISPAISSGSIRPVISSVSSVSITPVVSSVSITPVVSSVSISPVPVVRSVSVGVTTSNYSDTNKVAKQTNNLVTAISASFPTTRSDVPSVNSASISNGVANKPSIEKRKTIAHEPHSLDNHKRKTPSPACLTPSPFRNATSTPSSNDVDHSPTKEKTKLPSIPVHIPVSPEFMKGKRHSTTGIAKTNTIVKKRKKLSANELSNFSNVVVAVPPVIVSSSQPTFTNGGVTTTSTLLIKPNCTVVTTTTMSNSTGEVSKTDSVVNELKSVVVTSITNKNATSGASLSSASSKKEHQMLNHVSQYNKHYSHKADGVKKKKIPKQQQQPLSRVSSGANNINTSNNNICINGDIGKATLKKVVTCNPKKSDTFVNSKNEQVLDLSPNKMKDATPTSTMNAKKVVDLPSSAAATNVKKDDMPGPASKKNISSHSAPLQNERGSTVANQSNKNNQLNLSQISDFNNITAKTANYKQLPRESLKKVFQTPITAKYPLEKDPLSNQKHLSTPRADSTTSSPFFSNEDEITVLEMPKRSGNETELNKKSVKNRTGKLIQTSPHSFDSTLRADLINNIIQDSYKDSDIQSHHHNKKSDQKHSELAILRKARPLSLSSTKFTTTATTVVSNNTRHSTSAIITGNRVSNSDTKNIIAEDMFKNLQDLNTKIPSRRVDYNTNEIATNDVRNGVESTVNKVVKQRNSLPKMNAAVFDDKTFKNGLSSINKHDTSSCYNKNTQINRVTSELPSLEISSSSFNLISNNAQFLKKDGHFIKSHRYDNSVIPPPAAASSRWHNSGS